jgi:cytochrome c oxidase cbb3-type subunit 3
MIVYHVTDSMPLQTEEYQAEVAAAEIQIANYKATQPTEEAVDLAKLEYNADVEIIAAGKKIFDGHCASCHLADGGGMIGPNLVDEYWLHGGSILDIYTTIQVGVPEKGMISWKGVLNPEQIRAATFYIMSLQGTTPANPKAPQGEKYVPAKVEESVAPADSVETSI